MRENSCDLRKINSVSRTILPLLMLGSTTDMRTNFFWFHFPVTDCVDDAGLTFSLIPEDTGVIFNHSNKHGLGPI